jgi:hypothetical protein
MQCECGYNGEPAQRSVISEDHGLVQMLVIIAIGVVALFIGIINGVRGTSAQMTVRYSCPSCGKIIS